jgi:hypothetical protein
MIFSLILSSALAIEEFRDGHAILLKCARDQFDLDMTKIAMSKFQLRFVPHRKLFILFDFQQITTI